MKFLFKTHYLVLLLSLGFLFSCKKDDATIKVIVPEEKPTLFEQIQGKWNVDVEFVPRISKPVPGKLPDFSAKVQDVPTVTSIEFFGDSTYILVFNQYRAYTNKFTVKDSSTLSFTEFGDVSDIKVSSDSISFTFSYYDVPVSVKAAKSAKFNVPDNKKALLKEWILTREEDGAVYYGNADENTQITYLFTSSGTFGVKYSSLEEYYLYALNWKEHNTKSDGIVYYYGENSDGDYTYSDYIKIVEVSATTLKLQLINVEKEYDDDDNIIGTTESVEYTLVFTAK